MSEFAIETSGLSKRYGETVAVTDLDLVVQSDEIYGFLGPNGAGKSTTIGLLVDYLRPTGGTARVLGRDPQADVIAVHQRIGILPERFSVYDDLTGRRHLKFIIDTKGTADDPATMLERVGLAEASEQQAGTYSQGMAQRLALAMALVGEPELLVLDEPFTGLDPHGVRTVRQIVHEENQRGAAVFFSSHVLGQVELVCDRIGILHNGRLIAEGTLDELRAEAGESEEASIESLFVAYTDTNTISGEDNGGEGR